MCAAQTNKKRVMTMMAWKHVLILHLVAALAQKDRRNVEPTMDLQVIAPIPNYAVPTMKNYVSLMIGTLNQRAVPRFQLEVVHAQREKPSAESNPI